MIDRVIAANDEAGHAKPVAPVVRHVWPSVGPSILVALAPGEALLEPGNGAGRRLVFVAEGLCARPRVPCDPAVGDPEGKKNIFERVEFRQQVMELEDEFDIDIPDDAAEKISTVGQAIEFIDKAKAAG